MSSLSDIPSHLGMNDMNCIRIDYNMPFDVILIASIPIDWVDLVKLELVYFYEKFLKVRIIFPMHAFI